MIYIAKRISVGNVVVLGACLGLIVFIYWQVIQDISAIALVDIDRGYVVVAPLVAGYLAWLRRSRWRNSRRSPSIAGPVVILAAMFVSHLGNDYDIIILWQSGFVIAVLGLLISFYGLGLLRDFFVPILAAFLILPVPGSVRDAVAVPLQASAAYLTTLILEVANVNVMQIGNIVEVNGVMVTIGEACDGMRLMLPIGLSMFAFVFSLPLKMEYRIVLVILSIPVAFVCNVIRLVVTSIAFGFFPESASFVHDAGGWVVIPCAVLSLYGCLRIIQWLDLPVSRWRLAIE